MSDKAALRQELRSRYAGEAARRAESSLICAHILASPLYAGARVIGGYMPLRHEADVTAVLLDALKTGRTLALPLCGQPPHMTLRRGRRREALAPGAYGFPAPAEDTEIIAPDAIGLLLVPLEGVDPSGMRLGKGGGYYDCLLSEANVPAMGCALSWQWVQHVPAQPWDRPLTACADRDGVHLFSNMSK